jgi:hypothetical protein
MAELPFEVEPAWSSVGPDVASNPEELLVCAIAGAVGAVAPRQEPAVAA